MDIKLNNFQALEIRHIAANNPITGGRAADVSASSVIDTQSGAAQLLLLQQRIDDTSLLYTSLIAKNDILTELAQLIAHVEAQESALRANSDTASQIALQQALLQAEEELTLFIGQQYHINEIGLNGYHIGAEVGVIRGFENAVDSFDIDLSEVDAEAYAQKVVSVSVDFDKLFSAAHDPITCPTCQAATADIAGQAAINPTYTSNVTGVTATSATTTDYIEALRYDSKWDVDTDAGETLTYSFYQGDDVTPYAASAIPSGNDNTPIPVSDRDAGNEDKIRAALASWDEVIGMDLSEITETAASDDVGEMRIAILTDKDGASNTYAFAYYPNAGVTGGDIWFDGADVTQLANEYSFGYFATIHEMGHAIGLTHPFSHADALPALEHNSRNTVMSYNFDDRNGYIKITDNGDGSYRSSYDMIYAATPMKYDIAVGQLFYGIEAGTNAGNTTYTFDVNPVTLETIYDGGGSDTIDASNQTRGNIIDLTPGANSSIGLLSRTDLVSYYTDSFGVSSGTVNSYFSYFDSRASSQQTGEGQYSDGVYRGQENVAIAYSAIIENAKGGSGDDEITGNDEDNNLYGNAGDDRIKGGDGNDKIYGGDGDDTAIFSGNASSYRIKREADAVSVTHIATASTDYLSAIEFLEFDDQTINFEDLRDQQININIDARKSIIRKVEKNEREAIGGEGRDRIIVDPNDREAKTLDGRDGNDILTSGSGNDTVLGGAGRDVLRGGAGRDVLDGGTGDDRFILVGQTLAGAYGQDAITNSAGDGVDFSEALDLAALNNNSESDVSIGEIIRGGEGRDAIFGYGTLDLSVAELDSIEDIRLNSRLRIRADQLADMARAGGSIKGDGSSVVEVIGSTADGAVDFSALSLSDIDTLILGENVKAVFGASSASGIGKIIGVGEVAATDETAAQHLALAALNGGSGDLVVYESQDQIDRYSGFMRDRYRLDQQLLNPNSALMHTIENVQLAAVDSAGRMGSSEDFWMTGGLARKMADRHISLNLAEGRVFEVASNQALVSVEKMSIVGLSDVHIGAGTRLVVSAEQIGQLSRVTGEGALVAADERAYHALLNQMEKLSLDRRLVILEDPAQAAYLESFKFEEKRLETRILRGEAAFSAVSLVASDLRATLSNLGAEISNIQQNLGDLTAKTLSFVQQTSQVVTSPSSSFSAPSGVSVAESVGFLKDRLRTQILDILKSSQQARSNFAFLLKTM